MMKMAPSKAVLIRFNLVLFALFFLLYTTLLLRLSSLVYFENADSLVSCSLCEFHLKVERGVNMQELMEDSQISSGDIQITNRTILAKLEMPSFMDGILKTGFGRPRIGMVNVDDNDISEWKLYGETIPIHFDRVSSLFKWQDLFPEWIDEDVETDASNCPEIPMPDLASTERMDVIVAKLPCKYPEEGCRREVARLQVHLVVAHLAAKKAKRDWRWRTTVVLWSKCQPMIEIFRCDDFVRREGDWWLYRPEVVRLQQKLDLPVGSCNLALPLWGRQGVEKVYDASRMGAMKKLPRREAYATMLHSSEAYVCGAITLAQSLLQTKTKRDLVLLHDNSISRHKLEALAAAGWQLRLISRIQNPRAENDSYNEYNYSKFRLWQLTEYVKIIFIDADIIVLRNLDILFFFPQMSATGNDVWMFNSGVMVIEPSSCMFRTLMSQRNEIVSYNGGDQGYLNEIFMWWHRLPRRINFLKNFRANTGLETNLKNHLFSMDPPELYSIHYLGWKPWLCYRDYDCNYDAEDQLVYASDAAHERWWRVHDAMDEGLKRFCRLTKERRRDLNWERRKARLRGSSDQHWRINVTDPRRRGSYLID